MEFNGWTAPAIEITINKQKRRVSSNVCATLFVYFLKGRFFTFAWREIITGHVKPLKHVATKHCQGTPLANG